VKLVSLKAPVQARPVASDFALIDAPRPTCPDGGIVARVIYVSLDPYVGSRLRGRHMGEPAPAPVRDMIPGGVVAQVVETRHATLREGDYVHSMEGGWAEFVALAHARRIDPAIAPLSAHIGVLGMPGLTAWAGVAHLAKVTQGDVFLVDAAAGPVGGTAGQIARILGADRVVGIAGGAEKCALVNDRYGFDACVDYKAPDWIAALDASLPEPPTAYFENVGVSMLVVALQRMKLYGRAVLCGLVDQYHADAALPQIPAGLIVGKRAALYGLVVYDFYPRFEDYVMQAAAWIRDGALRFVEDRVDGLENAPALFEKLMTGANVGKAIVAVSPERV
jgi:NADPH-dependent curcumin reductase CurA